MSLLLLLVVVQVAVLEWANRGQSLLCERGHKLFPNLVKESNDASFVPIMFRNIELPLKTILPRTHAETSWHTPAPSSQTHNILPS